MPLCGDVLRLRFALSSAGGRGGLTRLGSALAALVLAGFIAAEVAPHFSLQKLGASAVMVGALLALGALGLLAFAWLQRLPQAYRATLFVLAPLVVLFVAPADDWRGFALPIVLLLQY